MLVNNVMVGQYGSFACIPCPEGYYSYSDFSPDYCTWCGDTANEGIAPNPDYHWISGPLRNQCACDPDWSGDNCEIHKCSLTLPGGSLGSLLLNADLQLTQYSSGFNGTSDQITNALRYLSNLLRVGVDINGDGIITKPEMIFALKYRSVGTSNIGALSVWCPVARVGVICFEDSVEVSTMYNQSVQSFLYTSTHTFDGSGNPVVANLSSTYPEPWWDANQCRKYDSSVYPLSYSHVTTM